ncbi:uncharacterized protein NECHADRAFT_46394 [Fusarium vanettenii 77-13-4]|uniref:NAD-dependent epimerase/dehydratase domain-containing protein n=1 Tax=Fusarium vanettenii (strain ATCC MYA-4622 / CBS 123669 / FGSC 9596 / NRRL 45880 / 77-13-4) TaxID=660122 RepID=C7Z462_FUSV7|nr:uncharacterized protein NECHADRAFT_46394 [Fusarium vanettenii 77-13-4]EEU41260.1 hypothetical protein NECHADRAFT_46394 [Fusarium vanettenii 77-13-4]
MVPSDNFVIPKGSTVMVTGVNGFIGSHVADQFLQFGFKVRGTVRDTAKNTWVSNLFEKKYGKGSFELVSVPNMTVDGALDEGVKGVSALIHVATVVNLSPDPNQVIPTAIDGAVNAIKSAYKEPSVRRFVLTSSTATLMPVNPEKRQDGLVITHDTWSEDAVELAWAPPPYAPERSLPVYAASKIEQERAIWKFYDENKDKRPDMVVNTVLPNLNLGKSLDLVHQGHASTSCVPVALWAGEKVPDWIDDPTYFIDVQDDALLHIAAAVLPDVKGERIFGMAEPLNWDKILAILRKQNPGRRFYKNFADGGYSLTVEPRDRAEHLLRELGRPGWTSLEDSILGNTEDLREAS